MSSIHAVDDTGVRDLLRGCWPSLPALALGSAVVCIAAVVPLVAAPGVNAVSMLLAAVCVGPAFAALVAVVDRIAADGEAGLRDLLAARQVAASGIRIALVPAVAAALFLAAHEVWIRTHSGYLWPSMAVSGAVAAVLAVVAFAAFAVRPMMSGEPDGTVWRHAAARVVLRPDRYAAAVVLAGLALWVALAVNVTLVVLFPAPVAVVLVAATRATVTP